MKLATFGSLAALICGLAAARPQMKLLQHVGSSSDELMQNFSFSGFLVFFMQIGFIFIERGFVRAKNVRNILLKNCINIMLSALCWWAVGFAFAYGQSAGGVIGYTGFFRDSGLRDGKPCFFSWTFAISTASIVSGCLAERTALHVYPVLTVLITMLVHPVAAHWVWNSQGWLQSISRCEFLDFAGGSVVHCVGGIVGLVGATRIGPRIGRFDGDSKPIPGHDVSSVCIGTLMLMFGWYGFNTGSVYTHNPSSGYATDRVAMCMTLSACASGLTALLVATIGTGSFDLSTCCNGLLIGLVAATGSCGYIPNWAAVVIGTVAGASYRFLAKLLVRLRIDDPLDSSVIHLGGGLTGVLLNGAFAKPSYVAQMSQAHDEAAYACGGFFLSRADGGTQLGMQLLGALVVCFWTLVWSLLVFWVLSRVSTPRVDQATELAGIDNIEHGGPAYPEFNLVMQSSRPA